MKLFDDKEVGLVYSNYHIYNEESKKSKISTKKVLPTGSTTNSLLENYNLGIITVVIKKELFDKFNYNFDGRYNMIGDFDLIIKLSKVSKFACVQSGLAYWRSHKNNSSYINYELEIRELEYWLKNQKIFDSLQNTQNSRGIKLKIIYRKTINCILNGDKKTAFKNIIFFPWNLKKIRLIMAFLAPKKILRKIKKIK